MSDEISKHGQEEFEREDLNPRVIVSALAGLAVICVVMAFLVVGFYKYMDAYSKAHEPPQNPLVTATKRDPYRVSPEEVKQFPDPRLETDETKQLNDVRLGEEQTLNSYGWVDEKGGVVHIPIQRAMELLAQRGLPVLPAGGTAPAASSKPVKKIKAVKQ